MLKYYYGASSYNKNGYQNSLERPSGSGEPDDTLRTLQLEEGRLKKGQRFAGYHVSKVAGSTQTDGVTASEPAYYYRINEYPVKATTSASIRVIFNHQEKEQELYVPILPDIHALGIEEREKRIASHLKTVVGIILSSEPGKAYILQGSYALGFQLKRQTTVYTIQRMEDLLGINGKYRVPLSEDDWCDIDLVTPHRDHGIYSILKILWKSLGNNTDMFNITQAEGTTEIREDISKLLCREEKENNREKCFEFIVPISQEHYQHFDKYKKGETKQYRILTSITIALMLKRVNVKGTREVFHVDITHPPEKEPDPEFILQPPYQKEYELARYALGKNTVKVITFRQCLNDLLEGLRQTKYFKDFCLNKFLLRVDLIISLNKWRCFDTTQKLIQLPDDMDLWKEKCYALSNPNTPNRKSYSNQQTQTELPHITQGTNTDQTVLSDQFTQTDIQPLITKEMRSIKNSTTLIDNGNQQVGTEDWLSFPEKGIQTDLLETINNKLSLQHPKPVELVTPIEDSANHSDLTKVTLESNTNAEASNLTISDNKSDQQEIAVLLEDACNIASDHQETAITESQAIIGASGSSIGKLFQLIEDKEREIKQLVSNHKILKSESDTTEILEIYNKLVGLDKFFFMRDESNYYRLKMRIMLNIALYNIKIDSNIRMRAIKFENKTENHMVNQKNFINMLEAAKFIRMLSIIELDHQFSRYSHKRYYDNQLSKIDFEYLDTINKAINLAVNIFDLKNDTHVIECIRQNDISSTVIEKHLTEIIRVYLYNENVIIQIDPLILKKVQKVLLNLKGKIYPEILLPHINLYIKNNQYRRAVSEDGGGLPGDHELQDTLAELTDPVKHFAYMSTIFQELYSFKEPVKAAIILIKHLTLIMDETQKYYSDIITENSLKNDNNIGQTIINICKAITPAAGVKEQKKPGTFSLLEQAECQYKLLLTVKNSKAIAKWVITKIKIDETACKKRLEQLRLGTTATKKGRKPTSVKFRK